MDDWNQQRKKEGKGAAREEGKQETQGTGQEKSTKSRGCNADGTGGIGGPVPADRVATQWDDSVIQPSDTRPGKLE